MGLYKGRLQFRVSVRYSDGRTMIAVHQYNILPRHVTVLHCHQGNPYLVTAYQALEILNRRTGAPIAPVIPGNQMFRQIMSAFRTWNPHDSVIFYTPGRNSSGRKHSAIKHLIIKIQILKALPFAGMSFSLKCFKSSEPLLQHQFSTLSLNINSFSTSSGDLSSILSGRTSISLALLSS